MASDNRGKASIVLENLTLDSKIDWKIENFFATLQGADDPFEGLISDDYKIFFLQVNKTFTFALKVNRGLICWQNFADISLLNRNPEDIEVTAELKVGSLSSSSTGKIAQACSMPLNLRATRDQLDANSSAGSLSISVKFSILSILKSTTVGHLGVIDSDQMFHQSLGRLLTDSVFSDFTISCGSEKFQCHKVVLANRSDVFARLLTSKDWTENKKNLFQINDHDPAVVKQMLEFVYSNRIPDGTECSVELLVIADQFNLQGLIQLCESEISKKVTCQSVTDILRGIHKVADAKHLKDYATDFMANNITSIVKTSDWKEIIASPKFLDAIEDPKPKKSRSAADSN